MEQNCLGPTLSIKILIYRFKSELKTLRKKYSTETEKAKNQFMNIHSKQVELNCLQKFRLLYIYDDQISDLQSTLSHERSTNKAAVENLKLTQEKVEELKRKLEYNEGVNLGLNKELDHLNGMLAQKDQEFKCEVRLAIAVFIIIQLWCYYS